jgi:hypothetical protein
VAGRRQPCPARGSDGGGGVGGGGPGTASRVGVAAAAVTVGVVNQVGRRAGPRPPPQPPPPTPLRIRLGVDPTKLKRFKFLRSLWSRHGPIRIQPGRARLAGPVRVPGRPGPQQRPKQHPPPSLSSAPTPAATWQQTSVSASSGPLSAKATRPGPAERGPAVHPNTSVSSLIFSFAFINYCRIWRKALNKPAYSAIACTVHSSRFNETSA